jgi:hypothetical protein
MVPTVNGDALCMGGRGTATVVGLVVDTCVTFDLKGSLPSYTMRCLGPPLVTYGKNLQRAVGDLCLVPQH